MTYDEVMGTRVHYDSEGQFAGWTIPLWMLVIKWALILGVLASPIYAMAHILGLPQNSMAVGIVALVWVAVWLGLIRLRVHNRLPWQRPQLPPGG